MPAEQLMKRRVQVSDISFYSITIWKVSPNIRGSHHGYKYSMAYVVEGICVMRYDNEAGKGDHKHIGDTEVPVVFTDIASLIRSFIADMNKLRR